MQERLPLSLRAEEVAAQLQGLVENYRTLEELRDECLRRLRNDEGRIEIPFGEPREGDGAASGKRSDGAGDGSRSSKDGEKSAGSSVRGPGGAKKTEHPVTLLLQTLDAMRQHLAMIASMTDRMYEVKEVERFEQTVLAIVQSVDPDVAERIRVSVWQRLPPRGIRAEDGTAAREP